MPLYEYYCPGCHTTFETLRPAPEADAPVACPACQEVSSQRILSLFAKSVKTGSGALTPAFESMGAGASMGGGCCGGACGCHN